MKDSIRSITDQEINTWNGFLILGFLIMLTLICLVLLPFEQAIIIMVVVTATMSPGFFILNPNEGKAFTFFGKLSGVWREPGFYWCNIFYSGTQVDTKLVNFDTNTLKVNDLSGNPIEVTAIVVYHITGIAKSVFAVENLDLFVANQSEAALRSLVSKYPYSTVDTDNPDEKMPSLLTSKEEVSEELEKELTERLNSAGVIIDEAHLNHLAYSPEIASDMLKVQQADAVIQARKKLVNGAVEIVAQAVNDLKEKDIKMLPDDVARLTTNLITVLVSESSAQPVVPLGNR
ncbi:MAG: SPFH domain-containing protein [Mariprofundaceae bacterium]